MGGEGWDNSDPGFCNTLHCKRFVRVNFSVRLV